MNQGLLAILMYEIKSPAIVALKLMFALKQSERFTGGPKLIHLFLL
jgi:hypothetical protein